MLNSANRFLCCILAVAVATAFSHGAVDRTTISTQRVVEAMSVAGIVASADQIEILSRVESATPNPAIRVVSVSNASAGTVKAKLRCRDSHECVPFYVLVHGLGFGQRNLAALRTPAIKALSLRDTVRDGDHAILIVETLDARMTFPVICLQRGTQGQVIRAASLDRKRLYNAEVVSAGVLKGSF